ncbi:YbaN family protein [Oceaniglobus ichthyenteri]|uniref:YbaN family protein n=1 Tax=Oceaniglobus ichthyenteri TaxID=2136177 RepID=UPI000D3B1365|nr:YbaN family protein [Oceaniglobus ichthyenteri]
MVRTPAPLSKATAPRPHIATRLAWQVVGGLALTLGLVGAVLPVLPTAPFVILAAFAFARGAPSVQRWLERNPMFGPIILDWRENGAIATKYKILAVSMMVMSLGLGFALALPAMVIAFQAICIAAVTVFILTRPSRAAPTPPR